MCKMKWRILVRVLALVAISSLLFATSALAGSVLLQGPSPAADLGALLAQLAGLVGITSFIAMLVNAGKAFGLVTDDWGGIITTGLDTIALVGLWVLNILRPEWIAKIDSVAAVLAQLGIYLITLIVAIGVSKFTHAVLRGFPVIGYSYSYIRRKQLSAACSVDMPPANKPTCK